MEVRIMTDHVLIYKDMDQTSEPLTELPVGSVVSIGKTTKKNGIEWVEAQSGEEHKGYILGDVDCALIRKVLLLQNETAIYQEPSSTSPVVGTMFRGTEFFMEDPVDTAEGTWVRMHDTAGKPGFIIGDVKVKVAGTGSSGKGGSLTVWALVGGGTFFLLNIVTNGAVPGGAVGGAIGGLIGGIIGSVYNSVRK